MEWVNVLLWIGRIIAVVALLCFAAALATPPGRLPLALRGLQKMLSKDQSAAGGEASSPPQQKNVHPTTSPTASPARRFAALLLVLLAAVLAMI